MCPMTFSHLPQASLVPAFSALPTLIATPHYIVLGHFLTFFSQPLCDVFFEDEAGIARYLPQDIDSLCTYVTKEGVSPQMCFYPHWLFSGSLLTAVINNLSFKMVVSFKMISLGDFKCIRCALLTVFPFALMPCSPASRPELCSLRAGLRAADGRRREPGG